MEDQLSMTFGALADPTRRAILQRLAEGEATVNDLAAPFQLKLPSVSKHLRVLQRAGLITQGRKAQWRPCRLEPAPLKEVAEWAERFRIHFENQFQRIDAYLNELDEQPKPKPKPKHGDHDHEHDRIRTQRAAAPSRRKGRKTRSGKA
jgi:DNA-binding transcriptional ArsR family regulator